MKKIISLLLVFILGITVVGCSKETSTQKTEEELRAEIKAEMEAEAKLKEELKAEIKAEMESEEKKEEKTEDPKTETNKENATSKGDEALSTLKGKLLGYGLYGAADVGVGIELDSPITIDNREVKEVYFKDESILDFVPRKYFTYYYEGCTSLKEECHGQIPIEIKVDPEGYGYDEEYDGTSGIIVKVISVDGEKDPTDKTGNEYPLDYYKTLFETRAHDGREVLPKDIKDHYFYKNTDDTIVGDDFRIAVDKIIEAGYSIRQIEGEYSIVDLSKETSTDVDITLSANKFLETYPTDYVETTEDGGYHGYDTVYQYPNSGLTVTYYHEKENSLEDAYLGSINITSHSYKIKGMNIAVGMSLAETYEYCNANLDHFYDRHSDTYVDEVFVYNDLVLAFNDRSFGEHDEVSSDDKVTQISLWLMED